MRIVLWILVALGVLGAAAVALAWQAGVFERHAEYRMRTQTSEAFQALSDARLEAAMFWLDNGRMPADAAAVRLTPESLTRPDRFVERIEVRSGTVVATLGGERVAKGLAGTVLAISPCLGEGDMIEWACGFDVCGPGQRAAQGAPPAFELTTVPFAALPASCRGLGPELLALRDAALRGEADAEANWGALLWDGQMLPADRAEGLRLLRKAAAAASPDGMAILGYALFQGDPDLLPRDYDEAHHWLTRAIEAGQPRAGALREELERAMRSRQPGQARLAEGAIDL
ncbi:MAG TPA: pilin [Xanthomonadaceae bacterium]|nr:pilin [Xanthomonadaceae bacterium]